MLKKMLIAFVLGGGGYLVWRYLKRDDDISVTTGVDEGFIEASFEVFGEIESGLGMTDLKNMTPSLRLMDLLKKVEGFSSVAYLAQEGQMTIGYGHVIKSSESFNEPMSVVDAEKLFLSDLNKHIEPIYSAIKVNLNQHQFDAIVSFCFNVGRVGSDMAKFINAGDFDSAGNEFMKFVYYSERNKKGEKTGRKLLSNGLYKRRANEMKIFRSGIYPSDLRSIT